MSAEPIGYVLIGFSAGLVTMIIVNLYKKMWKVLKK